MGVSLFFVSILQFVLIDPSCTATNQYPNTSKQVHHLTCMHRDLSQPPGNFIMRPGGSIPRSPHEDQQGRRWINSENRDGHLCHISYIWLIMIWRIGRHWKICDRFFHHVCSIDPLIREADSVCFSAGQVQLKLRRNQNSLYDKYNVTPKTLGLNHLRTVHELLLPPITNSSFLH